MSIMDIMRNFANNPENPKKAQVSYMAVIGVLEILKQMDPEQLSADDRKAFDFILHEFTEKKNALAKRQCFSAIKRAQTPEEKQAASENYLYAKNNYR